MEEGINLFHPYLRVYLFGAGTIEFPDGTRRRVADWSIRSQSLTLFLLLLCHPERRVSRDALVGAIWPGQSYRTMGSSLNVAKSLLATALAAACGSPLVPRASGEPPVYRLCEQTLLWTDIDACQELIHQALNTKRVEEALPLWEAAYALMQRGSFLVDYVDAYWTQADWVQARGKALVSQRSQCALRIADLSLACGNLDRALEVLTSESEADPSNEDLASHLIALLEREGRNAQALQCYALLEAALLEQQDEPGEETKALARRLRMTEAARGVISLPSAPSERGALLPTLPPIWVDEVVFPVTVQAYEDVLALAWEAFYTSSVQRAASTVEHWLRLLALQINIVPALSDELTDLQCRFLQLKSVIARDRTDFPTAFAAIDEAIAIAFRLNYVELIASSLYRRAKIHAAQQRYLAAVSYLESALPYASASRDPLRCYISMLLAEIYSLLVPGNEEYSHKSLTLLDAVDRTVRSHGVLEGDGSYVKVDVPGLYMIRGDVLRRAGQFKEAQEAIVVVRDSLSRDFTRWQGNLLLSEARLALAEHDIATSVQRGCEVLEITAATRSRSGEAKVHRLYWDIWKVEPEHARVKELGVRLGLV
jgi:DNA-binding SARP family transcriptional activator